MCFKAAPATVYRKCKHRIDGVEKTYTCDLAPDGPNCEDPPYNHSITDHQKTGWCDDCVAAGKADEDSEED